MSDPRSGVNWGSGDRKDVAIGPGEASAGSPYGWLEANALVTGEETIHRLLASGQVTMNTGILRLALFTARKTQTVTQVRAGTTGTAAGATPTVVRFGLYTIAANGDGTLVASTPNDTALFAATNTPYTKALSASYGIVAGRRYGAGWLVVTAAASPTIMGALPTNLGSELAQNPRLGGSWGGQTDLPASFTDANLGSASSQIPYSVLLP